MWRRERKVCHFDPDEHTKLDENIDVAVGPASFLANDPKMTVLMLVKIVGVLYLGIPAALVVLTKRLLWRDPNGARLAHAPPAPVIRTKEAGYWSTSLAL